MAKSIHTIKCNKCDKEFNKEIEDTFGPDKLEQVAKGDIFLETCPHCNNITAYEHSILYTDNDKKFVVYFTNDMEDFKKFIKSAEEMQCKEPSNDITYRVVFDDIYHFMEKVGLLTAGINDIVAEVYKEILFINLKSDDIDDILFQFNDDCSAYNISVIRNESFEFFDVDHNMLNNLYEDVKKCGVIGRKNDYVVNRDLALKILYDRENVGPVHSD